MILQIGTDPGRSAFTVMPMSCKCPPGPMPDSIKSFGELKEEAETITSRFAFTTSILPLRSISTPVARPSSITMFCAKP